MRFCEPTRLETIVSRRDIRLEPISNNNPLFLLLYLLVVEPITFPTYYFITNSIIIPTITSRRKLIGKLITRETPLGIDISDPPLTEESIPASPTEPIPKPQGQSLPPFSDTRDLGPYL